ncbi:hypothetical protein SAMD00019534_043250 [Acytostelium subglobosum LB1]|uniref:hypothetical protein n=1 Tax=Acytostelium subglobosum LB1 TaxID=1410327 RepID=UPI000644C704|nr:hypothetical protein SAMD00019534_043250 [Acytostelium subglobosum LB1]GAM21150.1 hypothetical protein SAMD00019534_043250 [Acytostelium subglobosum LB1]|eukprot:XP_012756284.1 hypothetical protein SAMD00019534_043250 [Acytostelium subglobosum LB1]
MGNLCGKEQKEAPPKGERVNPAPVAARAAPAPAAAVGGSAPAPAPGAAAKAPKQKVAPATTTTTTTSTAGASSSSSSSSGPTTKSIKVDKELHKYIIGTKGATIKEIRDATGTTIDVGQDGGDNVSVSGPSERAVDDAIARIQDVTSQHKTQAQRDQEHKQMRDAHEAESQRTDAMYQKYQAEIDQYEKRRQDLSAEADKEYNAGNKDRARELREEAKKQLTLRDEAQTKASRAIFNDKNSKLDPFTVDLHGLQTKYALEFMDERMDSLRKQGNKGKQFTIITGAGNHSDENGPKIKPLIQKTLKERNIAFEEVNNGSITCTL